MNLNTFRIIGDVVATIVTVAGLFLTGVPSMFGPVLVGMAMAWFGVNAIVRAVDRAAASLHEAVMHVAYPEEE